MGKSQKERDNFYCKLQQPLDRIQIAAENIILGDLEAGDNKWIINGTNNDEEIVSNKNQQIECA